MIKKHNFDSNGINYPIEFNFIYPNNLEYLKRRNNELLSDINLYAAQTRFGSKKKNLVVVNVGCLKRKMEWSFDGNKYTLVQTEPIMLDGASTPVTIGDIRSFGPNMRRAFYVHDILYALFHRVPKKTADKIFTCFLEADGTNKISRLIMYASLTLFGNRARKLDPRDHWNYNRVALYINGRRVAN